MYTLSKSNLTTSLENKKDYLHYIGNGHLESEQLDEGLTSYWQNQNSGTGPPEFTSYCFPFYSQSLRNLHQDVLATIRRCLKLWVKVSGDLRAPGCIYKDHTWEGLQRLLWMGSRHWLCGTEFDYLSLKASMPCAI